MIAHYLILTSSYLSPYSTLLCLFSHLFFPKRDRYALNHALIPWIALLDYFYYFSRVGALLLDTLELTSHLLHFIMSSTKSQFH